jgi:hypothetical protein
MASSTIPGAFCDLKRLVLAHMVKCGGAADAYRSHATSAHCNIRIMQINSLHISKALTYKN